MDRSTHRELRSRWHAGCVWFSAEQYRSAAGCFLDALSLLPAGDSASRLAQHLYLCAVGASYLQRNPGGPGSGRSGIRAEIERDVTTSLSGNLPPALAPRRDVNDWWARARACARPAPVKLGMTRDDLCDLFGSPHRVAGLGGVTGLLPTVYRFHDIEFHFEAPRDGGLRLIHREVARPRLRVV